MSFGKSLLLTIFCVFIALIVGGVAAGITNKYIGWIVGIIIMALCAGLFNSKTD